jgi:CzcA family heavy metal efflux pump
MTISKLAVNNRVTVYIMTLIIVIAGAMAYVGVPKEASPSITIPYVFVSTLYFGVSPQDMENLVTQEIEKEVKSISDVKEITSISQESFSSVIVEFNPDIKIEDAMQKVRDKVSIAKSKMPADIEEPMINEINLSEQPMLYVNLSGNIGLARLKEVGDNLSDKIEGIPGVLSADVTGGLDREVKINIDADKLKYYNIGFNDVINTIGAENQSIPGGGVDVGESNYLVRVPGEFDDPEKVKDLVVKSVQEKPIYVRDVAEVIYGFKERTSYSRQNGREAVTLVIKKASGENIINIAAEIKALMEKEKPNMPQGIIVNYSGDESKHIKSTVHELENGVITGMILVCIILLAAMGLKNAMLVATSIPLSFLISFIVLAVLGITMNMIVLFSLILVLGIIVDDAIVVVENIYRLQEHENYNPHDAAIEGPREVQFPVTVATLTIISSFAPLLFFPGIVGEFMRYMPITLIICLFSSLFVAMVINPVLAAHFINVKKEKMLQEKRKNQKWRIITRFHHWFDRLFHKIILRYEKVLRATLKRRKTTIGLTVILLFFMFFIYGAFNTGVEFFPETEPDQASIYITLPVGTNIAKTNEITALVESKLNKYDKDIEYYVTTVGQEIGAGFGGGADQSNKTTISLNFFDREIRERSTNLVVEEIRKDITGISTADIRLEKQAGGPPTGPPINIEIQGDDFGKLGEISDAIKREIKDIPGIKDLKDNFDEARPEIKIQVDREKAALFGLTTSTIAFTVRTAINGTAASKYRVADEEYDMTVRLDSAQRNNISNIENLYIKNNAGVNIPLTSVAKVDFSGGIGAINRKDLNRVVTVSANAEGRLGNEVLLDVQNKLKEFKLPQGYLLKYTGEQEDQQESQSFLGVAFLTALLLVFFFIVIEFNSVTSPLIIMFTILLSLIGVFLGLLLTQTPFSIVMTGIGVISLAGIVVRNAIVMLDFQKELEKRGLSRDEALIEAGKIRLRPIFLTAAATIAGLIPLTTGYDFDWQALKLVTGSPNTAFWRPMGIAIIFGLSVSTFLTLIVIPSMFSWVEDQKLKIKRWRNRGKVNEEDLAMSTE